MEKIAVRRSSRILIDAIRKKDLKKLTKVLEQGTNIKGVDSDGNPPLHHGVKTENPQIVHLLIKHGAEIDAVNTETKTPLNMSMESKHFAIIKVLVENKARVKVDYVGPDLQEYPKDIADLFYQSTDVKEACVLGLTALHYAVQNDHFDGVKILLSKGADVNRKSSHRGYVPLHYAKSVKCADLLMKHGAEINVEDKYCCTPLYKAAIQKFRIGVDDKRNEQVRLIEALMMNGANGVELLHKLEIELDMGRDWDSMEGFRDVLRHLALIGTDHDFEHESVFSRFWFQCIKEIEKLKNKIIHENITYFDFASTRVKDFLTKHKCIEKLIKMLQKEQSKDKLEFPMYFTILEIHLHDLVKRRNLYDTAALKFSLAVPYFDEGHIVTREVLKYLDSDDMENFARAFQSFNI